MTEIGMLLVTVAAVILAILAILMPWFIYRTACWTFKMMKMLEKIQHDLSGISRVAKSVDVEVER